MMMIMIMMIMMMMIVIIIIMMMMMMMIIIIIIMTLHMSPCSTVLLQKLMLSQLNVFRTFYGIQLFITLFTSAHCLSLP